MRLFPFHMSNTKIYFDRPKSVVIPDIYITNGRSLIFRMGHDACNRLVPSCQSSKENPQLPFLFVFLALGVSL